MKKMYRAKTKGCMAPKETGWEGFSKDEEVVLRNGVFDDDEDGKELCRNFSIGQEDVSGELAKDFISSSFICTDKAMEILKNHISPDVVSFEPVDNFTWRKLFYFDDPVRMPEIPSDGSITSVSPKSKTIRSIEDLDIE